MNSMREALSTAGVVPRIIKIRCTVSGPEYRHVCVYNLNDECERRAVGSRIVDCLAQGLTVTTAPHEVHHATRAE